MKDMEIKEKKGKEADEVARIFMDAIEKANETKYDRNHIYQNIAETDQWQGLCETCFNKLKDN